MTVHGDNVFQNPERLEMESQLNSDGRVAGLKGLDPMPGISKSPRLSIDEDSCPQEVEVHEDSDKLFNPSWNAKSTGKKTKKVSSPRSKTKAQQTKTSPIREPMIVGTQKLGTWTRINRPPCCLQRGRPC